MSAIEQALEMHEKWNGKIETTAKSHVNSREDLAIAYTPGVAEPCKVIAKDPDAAYKYTMKANTIAVVSDGSAWTWQYRTAGCHACYGRKSCPFQRIRWCQCCADLPGHSGYRRDY